MSVRATDVKEPAASLKSYGQRGVVAVLVAMFLVVLVGLAAVVIDLGRLFVVKSELQNGADAGALAGVVDLVITGPEVAQTTATTYAIQPGNFRLTDPAPAEDAVTVAILGPEQLQVALRLDAGTTSGAMPTVFARVWGINTADVRAVAEAELNHKIVGTGPGNLLPFAINEDLVDGDGDGDYDLGKVVDIYPHPETPGNFGMLDLDGGSNSNSDAIDWIINGYDDTFIIPEVTGEAGVGGMVDVEGDPGISGGSLNGALSTRVGDLVLFPVFDQVTGEGANTSYRVVDLVGGVITSFQLTGEMSQRSIMVRIEKFIDPRLITGSSNVPDNNTLGVPVLVR